MPTYPQHLLKPSYAFTPLTNGLSMRDMKLINHIINGEPKQVTRGDYILASG